MGTSAVLAGRLAEQQRALALVRGAAAEVEAPAGLRARVEAQRRGPAGRWSWRLAVVAVGATAALAVALGLVLVGGGNTGERFLATLAATELAPGAGGEAALTRTSSGWRIELAASGLPRLAGGRFYEAWLRDAAGVLVPVGTFNDAKRVTLWAGVSPKRFTTVTVTRERANGEQASSGEKVLVGTVDVGRGG